MIIFLLINLNMCYAPVTHTRRVTDQTAVVRRKIEGVALFPEAQLPIVAGSYGWLRINANVNGKMRFF